MKKNKEGSCILIMVIISSVILLYYINMWHSTALTTDLVIKKYEIEKKFRLTESLYNYGLVVCMNNFDFLYSKKEQNINNISVYKGPWPPNSKNYLGAINILLQDESKILIDSTIIDQKNKEVFSIKSILINETFSNDESKKKVKLKKFTISNWQVNDN